MLEIDGSIHSGSGTLLRYAVALATLVGEPLHMVRIRAKREKPGLRPQHLQAIRACATLSEGELTGAEVGSQEIFYRPGRSLPAGGNFEWDIGTAGSATMLGLSMTLLYFSTMLSPPAFGQLVDWVGSYPPAWLLLVLPQGAAMGALWVVQCVINVQSRAGQSGHG